MLAVQRLLLFLLLTGSTALLPAAKESLLMRTGVAQTSAQISRALPGLAQRGLTIAQTVGRAVTYERLALTSIFTFLVGYYGVNAAIGKFEASERYTRATTTNPPQQRSSAQYSSSRSPQSSHNPYDTRIKKIRGWTEFLGSHILKACLSTALLKVINDSCGTWLLNNAGRPLFDFFVKDPFAPGARFLTRVKPAVIRTSVMALLLFRKDIIAQLTTAQERLKNKRTQPGQPHAVSFSESALTAALDAKSFISEATFLINPWKITQ